MSSAMGGSGKNNNVDEIRYKSYLTQLERQQEADVKEREEAHRDKLVNLMSIHEHQREELRKDYDVKISQEAEELERKLGIIRERNANLLVEEKDGGEESAVKVQAQYKRKIEQEKRNGEEQITQLQTHYKKVSDDFTKMAAKERLKATAQKGKSS